MSKKEHPDIQWLGPVNISQEAQAIRFIGPLRDKSRLVEKETQGMGKGNMKYRGRAWCWACMITGGVIALLMVAFASAQPVAAAEFPNGDGASELPTGRVAWTVADQRGSPQTAHSADDQAAINVAKSLSGVFRSVSKRVLPTVVAIENKVPNANQGFMIPSSGQLPALSNSGGGAVASNGGGMGSLPLQAQPRWGMPGGMGVGSGVIIDPSGLILTNNHVVRGDGEITIRLQDGREFMGNEVYTDPKTDIALVRVQVDPANPLPSAVIGDSDAAQVGDWVLALGQPFGLESTVTAGIISAKGRAMGITDREDFIQTDAAINPGNSGGPLVNLDGQVVGINTAISSRGGGNDGVGFAVPVNLAKWVADELIDDGVVQRAYLGVGIQAITQQLADQLGIAPRSGLLVTQVVTGSPAQSAGIRQGDVLVEFSGQSVTSPSKLQMIVERSQVGSSYPVKLLRQGEYLNVSYVAVEKDESAVGNRLGAKSVDAPITYDELGLAIDDVDAKVAGKLGLGDVSGVVVVGIRDQSPADRAGLRPGMVIHQVNRVEINSKAGFMRQLEVGNLRDGILMLVRSSEGSRYTILQN